MQVKRPSQTESFNPLFWARGIPRRVSELCVHNKSLQCSPGLGKGKGSPYSITERRVPELIPVLGSQLAGDASHKPDGRLPSLSVRPAVIPATVKGAATNFSLLGEQRQQWV